MILSKVVQFCFASVLFFCGANIHAADIISIAGRISHVENEERVDLIRVDGRKEVAQSSSFLYAGDRFDFRGEATVKAYVYDKTITYKIGSENKTIPAREVGIFEFADNGYLSRFRAFLSKPRGQIPVVMGTRSGASDAVVLKSVSVAPVGRQYLPAGTSRVALVWGNGAGQLNVRDDSGKLTMVDSGDAAWLVVSLPMHSKLYTLSFTGQSLRWNIEMTTEVPAPPWFQNQLMLSEAKRLVRAAWLLQDGPTEWRLFALTELVALAEAGNFVANALWHGGACRCV